VEKVNLVTFDFLPALSKKAQNLMDWVDIKFLAHTTKENAITSGGLKAVKGLVGPEVRSIVHHLRVVYGRAIASSGKGYHVVSKPEGLDDTIQHLSQRINSMKEVKEALIQTQKAMRKRESSQIGIFKK